MSMAKRIGTTKVICGLPALILLLVTLAAASASQVPGHVYVALAAKERLPEDLKRIINENLDSYLVGSAGPDIAYTAHFVQVGAGLFPAGTESHGDEPRRPSRSGDILLAMLKMAKDREDHQYIAFACGWLTHYCVDNVIHPLVNQHGGFYEVDAKRHKLLEMVECEHVFQQVDETFHHLYVLNPGAKAKNMPKVPAYFVNQAFADVFPGSGNWEDYKDQYVIRPDGTVRNRLDPPFVNDFRNSVENVRICSDAMLRAHRTQGYGLWATLEFLVALKGPPPSPEQYRKLQEPLKISDVKLEITEDRGAKGAKGFLVIDYTINDLQLYKLFCDDWNAAAQRAVNDCVSLATAWWTNARGFKVPNLNLNVGPKPFEADKAWPGRPSINLLWANVMMTDANHGMAKILMPDRKTAWQHHAEWVWCPIAGVPHPDDPFLTREEMDLFALWKPLTDRRAGTATSAWGGVAGQAFLKVPFEAEGPGPYIVDLSLAYARLDDRKPYGIDDDWSGRLGSAPGGQEPEREEIPELRQKEPEPAKPPPSGAAKLEATSMLGKYGTHSGGTLFGDIFAKVDASGKITGQCRISDLRPDVIQRLGCDRVDAYAEFFGAITKWNKDFQAQKQAAMKKDKSWSVEAAEFEATGKWTAGKWLPDPSNPSAVIVKTFNGAFRLKGTLNQFQSGYSASGTMNFGYDRDEWVRWGVSSSTWDEDFARYKSTPQPAEGKQWPFPYWIDDEAKPWNQK